MPVVYHHHFATQTQTGYDNYTRQCPPDNGGLTQESTLSPSQGGESSSSLHGFLGALGYGCGDQIWVRAIAPKKTPSAELVRRGMAFEKDGRIIPLPIQGYLSWGVDALRFTRIYKDGREKVFANGLGALEDFNTQGYGIYFVVNPGGATNEEVTEGRSHFFECDDISKDAQWVRLRELEQATGATATVIETFKSLHCYFPVWPYYSDLGEWRRNQQRLIQQQDSDPAIHNEARLMRLPGFLHWRWDSDNEVLRAFPVELRQTGSMVAPDAFSAVLPPWDEQRWGKVATPRGTQSRGIDSSQECITPPNDDPWNILNFAPLLDGYQTGARRGWTTCKCPAHNGDSDNSLHIHESSGAFVCHGGCDSKAVYDAALLLAQQRGYNLPKGRKTGAFSIPQSQRLTRVTHSTSERYIADAMAGIDLAGAKVIAIKSPCSSGKTTWLEGDKETGRVGFLQAYVDQDIPNWMFTYRQQLEKGYGSRFGLLTREEIPRNRDTLAATGATICIHSARVDSKANFDGRTAPVGPVILDEVRGILGDLTDSPLVCRGKVIPQFVPFLRRCADAGYPIVLMDANLTDAEVDTIAEIVGASPDQVVTVENTYQTWDGRKVYTAPAPALTLKLKAAIRANDGPLFITTSSQKPGSSYGSHSLERICRSANPQATVLRVDKETIATEGHPAALLMTLLEDGTKADISEFVKSWKVIIVSPVIEAGWSLEIYGHFKAQFSFVQGNLPAENAVQQMLRLRDTQCPMYIAMPRDGYGMAMALKRGNGSDDLSRLRVGEMQRQRTNLHQLLAPSDDGQRWDTALLNYWLVSATRQNGSIKPYQSLIEAYLSSMGCSVAPLADTATTEDQKAEATLLKASALVDQIERAIDQGNAETLEDTQAKHLQEDKKYLTADEMRSLEKHSLETRYQCAAHPGLALLDALSPEFRGQAQLLFYLTIGRDNFTDHEQARLNRMAEDGSIFTPDLNKKLKGYRKLFLEVTGIAALLDREGEEISNDAPELERIGALLNDRTKSGDSATALLLGIKLNDEWGTVRRINHVSKTLLGVSILERVASRGKRGEKRRVIYRVRSVVPVPNIEIPAGAFLEWEDDTPDQHHGGTIHARELDRNELIPRLQQGYLPYILANWQAHAEARVTHS